MPPKQPALDAIIATVTDKKQPRKQRLDASESLTQLVTTYLESAFDAEQNGRKEIEAAMTHVRTSYVTQSTLESLLELACSAKTVAEAVEGSRVLSLFYVLLQYEATWHECDQEFAMNEYDRKSNSNKNKKPTAAGSADNDKKECGQRREREDAGAAEVDEQLLRDCQALAFSEERLQNVFFFTYAMARHDGFSDLILDKLLGDIDNQKGEGEVPEDVEELALELRSRLMKNIKSCDGEDDDEDDEGDDEGELNIMDQMSPELLQQYLADTEFGGAEFEEEEEDDDDVAEEK